jgi:uncharacterized membrane protein YkvA (DUF1232 family)
VIDLFEKEDIFKKSQRKNEEKAREYIADEHKTEGLLKQAIEKANDKKGTLGQAWEKLQLLTELVKAYSKGEYRRVSKGTILAVIGTILYFVSPLDIVPDFIVGLGILDDAAVIGFTIQRLSKELDEFKEWKNTILTYENPLK